MHMCNILLKHLHLAWSALMGKRPVAGLSCHTHRLIHERSGPRYWGWCLRESFFCTATSEESAHNAPTLRRLQQNCTKFYTHTHDGSKVSQACHEPLLEGLNPLRRRPASSARLERAAEVLKPCAAAGPPRAVRRRERARSAWPACESKAAGLARVAQRVAWAQASAAVPP